MKPLTCGNFVWKVMTFWYADFDKYEHWSRGELN